MQFEILTWARGHPLEKLGKNKLLCGSLLVPTVNKCSKGRAKRVSKKHVQNSSSETHMGPCLSVSLTLSLCSNSDSILLHSLENRFHIHITRRHLSLCLSILTQTLSRLHSLEKRLNIHISRRPLSLWLCLCVLTQTLSRLHGLEKRLHIHITQRPLSLWLYLSVLTQTLSRLHSLEKWLHIHITRRPQSLWRSDSVSLFLLRLYPAYIVWKIDFIFISHGGLSLSVTLWLCLSVLTQTLSRLHSLEKRLHIHIARRHLSLCLSDSVSLSPWLCLSVSLTLSLSVLTQTLSCLHSLENRFHFHITRRPMSLCNSLTLSLCSYSDSIPPA